MVEVAETLTARAACGVPRAADQHLAILRGQFLLGAHALASPATDKGPLFFALCPYRASRLVAVVAPVIKDIIMTIGTVKFFNMDKGYGFIAPEGGGADAFVHISAVEQAGMSSLQENQRVSYDVEPDKRGKMAAVNLQAA
jgi:CspA family cold shock protein